MKFYRLQDDVEYPNRWYLGDIKSVDNWCLRTEVPAKNGILEIEVFQDGEELDFTLSEVFGIPVVSEKIKQELECYPEVSFIPLRVARPSCKSKYFAMVIMSLVECVDEERSEFQKFEVNDPVRPDKAGEYRGFMKLRLKPNGIDGKNIFRIYGFDTAIVVSESVKIKLEVISANGLDFEAVV